MKRTLPAILTAVTLSTAGVLSSCVDQSPTGSNNPPPQTWIDPVTPSEPPPPEPASWIVTFNDQTQDPVDEATRIISETGGSLIATYRHAINGFVAEIPDDAIGALRSRPNVASVERDGVVSAIAFDMVTESAGAWGLDRIDQRDLGLSGTYSFNTDGSGVTVYVVDSGIRETHSEFQIPGGGSRAWRGPETDFVTTDPQGGYDCQGHGTHVSGTVGGNTYGVAKNVELVGVRVLGCDGHGYYSWMIAAIDWITARHEAGLGPSVVNMSLGGSVSSSLNNAIAQSSAKGVVYAVAAGNSGTNACNYSPASAPEALTVAASTSSDSRASFSNYGLCTDVFAPGTGIRSSTHGTDTSTGSWSGTSMATPHVAGVAALFLGETPWASAGEVVDAITTAATPGKISGANTSPNLLLYSFPDAPAPPSGADVRVSLSESADPIRQDGQVVYTTRVTNVGPESAAESRFEQTLPTSASVIAVNASQGTCSPASGRVDCDLSALPSGASVTVEVTVAPSESGSLNTQVAGSSATEDPDPSNNAASASTRVEAPPSPVAVAGVDAVSMTPSGKFQIGSVDVALDATRGGVTVTGTWYKDGESSPFQTAQAISNSNGVASMSTGKLRNVSYLNFCVTGLSGSDVLDGTSYPVCDPDYGSAPPDPGTQDPPTTAAPSSLTAVYATRGGGRVELQWRPGGGGDVDVYRGLSEGSLDKVVTTSDNGRYNDRNGTRMSYYQVCVSGSTSACSEVVPVQ
jgi:subtilisin family serine protease